MKTKSLFMVLSENSVDDNGNEREKNLFSEMDVNVFICPWNYTRQHLKLLHKTWRRNLDAKWKALNVFFVPASDSKKSNFCANEIDPEPFHNFMTKTRWERSVFIYLFLQSEPSFTTLIEFWNLRPKSLILGNSLNLCEFSEAKL